MAKARIVAALVRHGEYDQPAGVVGAHLPHPLNPRGRERARTAAPELVGLAEAAGTELHSVIDSSRLLRAWETATILAEELKEIVGRPFSVQQFADLVERSVGSAANLTSDEIARVLAVDPRTETPPEGWEWDGHYRLPLPGAESLMDAGERVVRHFAARLRETSARISQDTTKVFVGHGGAFQHAAVHMGILTAEEAKHTTMLHGRPILVEWVEEKTWRLLQKTWRVSE